MDTHLMDSEITVENRPGHPVLLSDEPEQGTKTEDKMQTFMKQLQKLLKKEQENQDKGDQIKLHSQNCILDEKVRLK